MALKAASCCQLSINHAMAHMRERHAFWLLLVLVLMAFRHVPCGVKQGRGEARGACTCTSRVRRSRASYCWRAKH